jgi:hypothetical protein
VASEVIRQVWCDICLRELDKRTVAEPAVATVYDDGVEYSIDGCVEHMDPKVSEVVKYGYPSTFAREKFINHRKVPRISQQPRAPRPKVQCLSIVNGDTCLKVVSGGPGRKLHEQAHQRKGEPYGDWRDAPS